VIVFDYFLLIIPSLFIFNSLISLFDPLTVSVIIETPFLVMVMSYSRYHFDPLHHHCSLNILLYRPLLYRRYYLNLDSIKVVLIGTIIIFIDSSGFNNVPLGKYNVISIS
jgi:hypothetical protein